MDKIRPLTGEEIRKALVKAFQRLGVGLRLPLPALICYTMLTLRTKDHEYLVHFKQIHSTVRSEWGNDGLFHRRRGVDGGIALRPRFRRAVHLATSEK